MFQIVLLCALTFGLAYWLMDGAPVPTIGVRPLQPDPDAQPLFERIAKRIEASRSGNLSPEEAARERFAKAWSTLTVEARWYEDRECDGEQRTKVVTEIVTYRTEFLPMHANYTGEPRRYLDGTLKKIVGGLFQKGLLTPKDFPSETRAWLATFVHPADEKTVRDLKRCQIWGHK
ncbi:hypothetical protein [Methyloceanibacter methanicus]|uniref:hypothetical protein n=1 Tax=Methyloceanibacter methanicus TaxID=1774968 RepID=UPI00114D1E9D|nr:hypothetical protein [Methyloceanibacter methanicus]